MKDRTILEHYYADRKGCGIFPDGPIRGERRREVNACRLPSSATSRNNPRKQEATPSANEAAAELPGSRLGASRRGPSWPIRWPKISPASPDEQESFDADKILRRADEPIQEKNVEFAVEFSHGVPADGLFRC